jgi:hypothetical protein
MFAALRPTLFVPEDQWGLQRWASNHPLTGQAPRHHGLAEAQEGSGGCSPATIPAGDYAPYGVDGRGMPPDGAPSHHAKTFVAHGGPGCPDRPPTPDPPPAAYPNGVGTPYAAFLALRWAPAATLENLANLERDFALSTAWGGRDAVHVTTQVVSDASLARDQGMILAALGNALAQERLREACVTPAFRLALRPGLVIAACNAGPHARGQDTGRHVSAAHPG